MLSKSGALGVEFVHDRTHKLMGAMKVASLKVLHTFSP